jgi:hypothetical protein
MSVVSEPPLRLAMIETATLATVRAADADESRNVPSWPAGSSPATVATLMAGAVVLLKPGSYIDIGGGTMIEAVVVARGGVHADGTVTCLPAATGPSAPALTKAFLDGAAMCWAPNALADAVGMARTSGPEHRALDGNMITLSPAATAGSVVMGYSSIGVQHELAITQAALQAAGVATCPWVAAPLPPPPVGDAAARRLGTQLEAVDNIHLARGAAQVLGISIPNGTDSTALALASLAGLAAGAAGCGPSLSALARIWAAASTIPRSDPRF